MLRTRNNDLVGGRGMMCFRMRKEVVTPDGERLCAEHMGEARTEMKSK